MQNAANWPPLYRWFAALTCGALLTLTFAPFNYWPLGIVSLAGLAYLLFTHSKNAIAISYCYGLGLFGSGVSWVYVSIHEHGHTGAPLALLLVVLFTTGLALFLAIFGAAFRATYRRTSPTPYLLFAALWTLGEWVRGWLATGFPWLYVGYGHNHTWLAGYMPVLGVYGPSFAIALISGYGAKLLITQRIDWQLSVPILSIVVGFALQHITWTQPTSHGLNIAAVQPNLSLREKWDRNNLNNVLQQMQTQTRLVKDSDIVVWPEASIPAHYPKMANYVAHLTREANRHGYTLIAGMPYLKQTDDQPILLNSQWVSAEPSLANQDQTPQFYYKQHLVPFGEYVPFEQWLRGAIRFFDLPSSHFQAGGKNQPQLLAAGEPISLSICYEVAFADLVARSANNATLLMTTSNDSWFGRSIGPAQHYQIAATRAVENAKPMVRVTNNGITGYIDHTGRTTASLPSYTRDELVGKVQPMQGSTPFSRWGSTLIVALCLSLIVAIQAINWRTKRRP